MLESEALIYPYEIFLYFYYIPQCSHFHVYFMYNFLIISYLLEKFTCYSHAIRWDIFFFFFGCCVAAILNPKATFFYFSPCCVPWCFTFNQHFTFHFSEPLRYHFFLSCHYFYIKSTWMLGCYRLGYK